MAAWFGHSSRAAKMSAWRNPDGADSLRGAADLVRADMRFGHIRPGPKMSAEFLPIDSTKTSMVCGHFWPGPDMSEPTTPGAPA